MPEVAWYFQIELSLGTTTYGNFAAFSGLSFESWNAVSGWKQQSVFSLHCVVRIPSQSMSMSAFQYTAPVLSQTAMSADVSASVLYLPFEICLQVVTLASSSAAVGAAFTRWAATGRCVAALATTGVRRAAPKARTTAPRRRARLFRMIAPIISKGNCLSGRDGTTYVDGRQCLRLIEDAPKCN